MAYAALMVAMGAVVAPTRASRCCRRRPTSATRRRCTFDSRASRTHELGPLPQLFADQFGWEEMAATVARAFHALPPEVQAKTAIFGQNYGQAGAIDLFGPKYGLPKAISGHQNYFLWGPRGYTGESMIVMGDRQERLAERVRQRRESRARGASVLDAVRAYRRLLLPRAETAARGDLAEGEVMELKRVRGAHRIHGRVRARPSKRCTRCIWRMRRTSRSRISTCCCGGRSGWMSRACGRSW